MGGGPGCFTSVFVVSKTRAPHHVCQTGVFVCRTVNSLEDDVVAELDLTVIIADIDDGGVIVP